MPLIDSFLEWAGHRRSKYFCKMDLLKDAKMITFDQYQKPRDTTGWTGTEEGEGELVLFTDASGEAEAEA